MKCLKCGAQSDYRARTAALGGCRNCGEKFVFEPRRSDPITDLSFQRAIVAVSDDGRLLWLERQLYYEVARRVRRRRLWHRFTRRALVSLEYADFQRLLARWTARKGAPSGRLDRGAFAGDLRAEPLAADAGAYAFERLIVVDSDEIADFLLANGFHADHKCAVLSARGYPTWAYDLLSPRLRAQAPTTVAVLHNADIEGCGLRATVQSDPRWFGGVDGVEVVDAGLRPKNARRFWGVYLKGQTVHVPSETISVDEAGWLRKYRLELEAARPRALLNVLTAMLIRGEEEPSALSSPSPWPATDWWGAGAWGDGGGDGDDVG